MALFGATGPKARRAALLIGAVLISHRPSIAEVVIDDEDIRGDADV